jgi:alanine racemase
VKNTKFSDIIAAAQGKISGSYSDFEVTALSRDTRTLQQGDVFIALPGSNYNVYDFISVAEQKGASAIISSQKVECKVPLVLVDDTYTALHKIAAWYRSKFTFPIICVTGSTGKTTTRSMINTVLASKYKVYQTAKNYNNHIGLPFSLLELDESYDAAVLEIGMNHTGEIEQLSKTAKPDIAVITNIGKAHIGNLGSRENIFKAKMEVAAGLKHGGTLVLNSDDDMLATVKSNGSFNLLFAGTTDFAQNKFTASSIKPNGFYTDFCVKGAEFEKTVTLPLAGSHNVNNALLAALCGTAVGVSADAAFAALGGFASSSMRTEVSQIRGVKIIKDYYNASPESAAAGLQSLQSLKTAGGKTIAVLGQIGELGSFAQAEHLALGKLCGALGVDYVFFIGENHTDVFDGLSGFQTQAFCTDDRTSFLRYLADFIKKGGVAPGDAMLIKGSRAAHMEDFFENIKNLLNSYGCAAVEIPQSPTRLYVDISAVKHNFAQIQLAAGANTQLMPMVKANAYGCGAEVIANIFRDCSRLAVADIKEAALLKNVLPGAGIVIIYQPYINDCEEIVLQNYIPAVSNLDFAKKLNKIAALHNTTVRVHVEVDTGFCRLGVDFDKCGEFFAELGKLKNLSCEGIFMHYSSADVFDDSDSEFTQLQTDRFLAAITAAENAYGFIKFKHACASAAIFNPVCKPYLNPSEGDGTSAENLAKPVFNMARPGYMIYGYYPHPALKKAVDLKPALKFVSVILQIKEVPLGSPIGYGRKFVTARKSKIATVAVGYSDGLRRRLFDPENAQNGCFAVNGQRAPIVGRISMDLTAVDITDIAGQVNVGDEVAIFDNSNITIEEIANICGTIGYEIIAQLQGNVDRVEVF